MSETKPILYFPTLTGIRAIAAYLVFFHHFNQQSFPYPVFRILNELHIGVTIFFVLSGFLICFRYYGLEKITKSWFLKYFRNRVARIYPMYFLLTTATFIATIWQPSENVYNSFPYKWLLVIMNLFFVRGFFDGLKFTGVGQGWSLTVEECFYMAAPLFFVGILKNLKNFFTYPLCLLLGGILLVAIFGHWGEWGFFGNYTFLFLYTFPGRCIEFFMGIWLAMVTLKGGFVNRSFPVYTLGGILAIIASVGVLASLPIGNGYEFGLQHPIGIFTNNFILPIGICFLFYGLIHEKSILEKVLSTKLMQLLGKSSYIFYLIHIGFISSFLYKWVNFGLEWLTDWADNKGNIMLQSAFDSPLFAIMVLFVLLNGIAFLLWHFIEEPMNLWIRKWDIFTKK